jgi:hypothetical protein
MQSTAWKYQDSGIISLSCRRRPCPIGKTAFLTCTPYPLRLVASSESCETPNQQRNVGSISRYGEIAPRNVIHPIRKTVEPSCASGLTCTHPRRAAVIAATSIFFILIIASNARFASLPPTASASVSTRGVICQEMPHLSLHQPHWLSCPPFPTIAFQ